MKTFSLSNRFAIALIAGSLAASTALAQGEFEGSGEIADPNCVGDGCGYISADQVSEDQAAAPNDENAESFSYSENGATSEKRLTINLMSWHHCQDLRYQLLFATIICYRCLTHVRLQHNVKLRITLVGQELQIQSTHTVLVILLDGEHIGAAIGIPLHIIQITERPIHTLLVIVHLQQLTTHVIDGLLKFSCIHNFKILNACKGCRSNLG